MLANLIAGKENFQIDEVRRSARVLRAGQPKFRQPEIQGAWAAETVSGLRIYFAVNGAADFCFVANDEKT